VEKSEVRDRRSASPCYPTTPRLPSCILRGERALLQYPCLVFLVCSLSIGCAAAPETIRKEETKSKDIGALHKYEETFNPADYDPEIPLERREEKKESLPSEEPTSPAEEVELVSGFRVQVTFTDNIDQANRIKDEVALLLSDEPVYVVYEAPYYKVRAGDFLSRPNANPILRILFENGYKDSWIVPDKVKR
jgi:hypothetical protein